MSSDDYPHFNRATNPAPSLVHTYDCIKAQYAKLKANGLAKLNFMQVRYWRDGAVEAASKYPDCIELSDLILELKKITDKADTAVDGTGELIMPVVKKLNYLSGEMTESYLKKLLEFSRDALRQIIRNDEYNKRRAPNSLYHASLQATPTQQPTAVQSVAGALQDIASKRAESSPSSDPSSPTSPSQDFMELRVRSLENMLGLLDSAHQKLSATTEKQTAELANVQMQLKQAQDALAERDATIMKLTQEGTHDVWELEGLRNDHEKLRDAHDKLQCEFESRGMLMASVKKELAEARSALANLKEADPVQAQRENWKNEDEIARLQRVNYELKLKHMDEMRECINTILGMNQ